MMMKKKNEEIFNNVMICRYWLLVFFVIRIRSRTQSSLNIETKKLVMHIIINNKFLFIYVR